MVVGSKTKTQRTRIFDLVRDTRWRSLDEIATQTGDPTPSISARLRDLRKPKYGGHTIEKKNMGGGLYAYRCVETA